MDKPAADKKWPLKRILVALLVLLILSPLLYLGMYKGYRLLDTMRFPGPSEPIARLDPSLSEEEKGAALAQSITLQLRRELDSTFGWSVNDLLISPTRYFDRRNNRQLGVIFATRMLMQFFSTDLAKYGRVDDENEHLKNARTKAFAYTERKWWFVSTEKRYREGLDLVDQYRTDLKAGKAVYNMRTDDMYNVLDFIVGNKFLDQPMGKLIQTNEQVPYSELEDRVYYAQGAVLVLRDFLHALVSMYPEITQKGGKENIAEAFRDMNRVCTFDPLIVLRGHHDSLFADHRGKLARYLINIRERINDVAQSVRR
jgi:hypothetical protein